jgi:3-oxoacyl-[acyl-carrier-protein] synthase II
MRCGSEPILITGAALATSLGLTRETTWRAVLEGRCGMGPLTALESPLPPDKLGGQALDLPSDYRPDEPREVRYLAWTIQHALRDAESHAPLACPPHHRGVLLGTTLHGMRAAGEYLRSKSYEPLRNFLASQTLARACAGLDLDGLAATTCSACSSSLGAIALAVTLLQAGELDLVIAGGYDTISEYVYGGFNALRLVADGPLRPFAKNRQGMKLAEGYGIVVLERADSAKARGARGLARILGFGESADAHHLTQPHPQGDGAARAIRAAFENAGIGPGDVDLIAAHATGTPDNDAGEYAAFASVFGEDLPRVPVVAFKSHLGHTLGGAGAVELILSAMAMREQVIPPCANSRADDVEFSGLNLSTGCAKPARISAALNTSLGFGGANTAAILGPPDVAISVGHPENMDETPMLRAENDVLITGIGVMVPGAVGAEAFARLFDAPHDPAWQADTGSIPQSEYIHLLNARRVRRMSEYVKLTLAATALALQDAGIDPSEDFGQSCSVILGSMHGSTDFSTTYYGEIVRQGLIGANPVLFAEGVPNAAAAHLSLMLSLKQACQTVIGSRTSGIDALHLAMSRIRSGAWERAIIGAAEEFHPLIAGAYGHCGLHAGACGEAPSRQHGFVTGSSAIAFVLESRSALARRAAQANAANRSAIRARGRVLGASAARGRANESMESTIRVLDALGNVPAVLSSSAGIWVDRAEAAAITRAAADTVVSSVYGHVAEHFSAGPLLGVASVLLRDGRMPRMMDPVPGLRPAEGTEPVDRFGVLCTDFTGCVSGAKIATESGIAR